MSLKESNKVETNRYELTIVVPAADFDAAMTKVFQRENKKITIPGFRKGKAPRAFVEKYYGESAFYEDTVNMLYPAALEEAVKESGLDMIEDKIDFDLVQIGKGKDLEFKVKITVKPEVSIEGYKGLEVTKPEVVVTDEDIDNEVKKVQERNSRMVTVEDRAAENGDITVIDFDGSVDGVHFDGGKAENYSLELGSGSFSPGFEEQVVGHHTGDEFDVNVKFPDDYHAEDLKGKDAVFAIKLHEIKKKELPQVDDDFVKDVSEFDTVDAYRADLKDKLTTARQNKVNDDADNQTIDQLVEKLQGEIPEAMYVNRMNEDVQEFAYRLQSQGLDMKTYMQYTGQTEDSIREQFRPQAERQVKIRLALEKIAALENVEATDEDVENEYNKLAEAYKMEADKVKSFIPAEELKKDIVVQKAIDLVRDSAVVKAAE